MAAVMRPCLAMLCLAIGACSYRPGAESDTPADAASPPPASASAAVPQENLAQWRRSCALCHVRGEGGAPRIGDTAAWAPRKMQGDGVLLRHTVEGFNNMPPLGYCMDCSADDFRRLIRFMAGS